MSQGVGQAHRDRMTSLSLESNTIMFRGFKNGRKQSLLVYKQPIGLCRNRFLESQGVGQEDKVGMISLGLEKVTIMFRGFNNHRETSLLVHEQLLGL